MPVPIRDLAFDAGCMRATLSFDRTPYLCVVPWHTVKAVVDVDRKGMVFDKEWAATLYAGDPSTPLAHPSERPYLRRVK